MAPKAELIFHGTGTSSCLPNIACLTNEPRCEACWLGADASRGAEVGLKPYEAIRNRRRNTGAILRYTDEGTEETVLVIDAGKTFVQAAIEWFPTYGLRRIDGLLLTHAHADAMNGLDDLRCWTLRAAIQPHIDIYLTQRTFNEVQRTFPYLVDKGMATGGGDTPDFLWHIINEFEPVQIKGVKVVPLPLHHGRYFEPQQTTLSLASPMATRPDTPNAGYTSAQSGSSTPASLRPDGAGLGATLLPLPNPLPKALFGTPKATSVPYPSLGFHLPHFLYFSDVSEIPPQTLQYVAGLTDAEKPEVLIVDCLRPKPYMSHFGLGQAVQATKQLSPMRSYLIGMTCGTGNNWITHRGWEQLCVALSDGRQELSPAQWLGQDEERWRCQATLKEVLDEVGGLSKDLWLRPSFDGMRIVVTPDGVSDGAYDAV